MGTNITGIGNANAIGFKSRVTGGMYFPPELKDALVGVWSAYGKSNDSTDRNIIKNKIKDRGGDFELINFNYEGTSGYNGYPVVFGKDKTYQYVNHSPNYNQTTINVTHFNTRQALLYSYIQRNGELTSYNRDYPSYKIKVSGLEEGFGLMYQYNSKADATSVNALRIETNGIYTIPKSFASDGSLTNANIWVGFVFTGTEQEQCNVTIEVLPEYKGAVVTDGVDDMIVSQNTVEEMGITDKFTVVSMIHQITLRGATAAALTNYIRQPIGHEYVRNHVANIGKTGIYGYAVYDVNHSSAGNSHIINTILGDKNDYSIHITGNLSQGKFSVQGYINGDNNAVELSQVAWYWTFIANKLLTEDEINLIIEKYNLDRPGEIVKPDVYYDIKRQKITNENHSSFDDELTDFSGNGHNMKLYNIAWEGNSGIGNYPVVFGANKTWKNLRAEDNNLSYKLIANSITVYKVLPNSGAIMWTYIKENEIIREIEIPSFTVKVSGTKNGDRVRYYYVDENSTFKNTIFDITEDGTYVLPKCNKLQITESTPSTNIFIGFVIILNDNPSTGVTIEVIPSNENAICLDGVDDYGKVTGLPIYKDYTVAALRKWLYDDSVTSTQTGSIVSKSKFGSDGAFIFEQTLNKNPSRSSTWCFGLTNSLINNDKLFEESFTYQTKYSYNNNPIQPGTGFDRDSMWLGSVRDNDSRYSKMAIWSLLLFPYSLSEFLLERQIKKARAGTLYPNQVEFRPIIPEDENITRIDYFVVNSGTWIVIKPGDYVDVGARIVFNVYTKLPYKVEKVSSPAFTGMSVRHSTELNIFDVEGYIKDKTPQKIKLTLAVNEDIVQWNPTITSNLLDSFTASSWYLNGWDNTLTEGTWIKKTDRVFFKATFKTELYGLETATFGGAECVVSKADNWSDSTNIWDIRMLGTVGDLSQVFNLDVYELIRFEDIVQPYPAFYEFTDENRNLVTWGSKIKVGSTITRIKAFANSNLLKDLYNISYPKLNGVASAGSKYVVERQMVFTCTATYLLDDNEPKCILSPSRLRIPNSSYKLLGYIPDISGHGNHGKINNSAYAGMSGANGYPYDYKNGFMAYSNCRLVDSEIFNVISISPTVNIIKNTPTYKGKIKVTGLSGYLKLRIYPKDDSTNAIEILEDGVYDINIDNETGSVYFHVAKTKEGSNDISVIIQQVGEYEGAYCLDGVDDFVTIPTLVTKQSLIKCNWTTQNYNRFLVDYRKDNASNGYSTNKTGSTDIQLAYNGRVTYIDGILNKNLIPDDNLKEITHCATIQYPNNVESETKIASAFDLRGYMQMALYTYIAFSEFSTEEKIKELNEYVGTEGNIVEWNPTITSNIPYKDISTYITTDGTTDLSPKVGNLYKKGDKLTIGIKPAKDLDEVGTVTINGVKIKRSSLTELGYYIYDTVLDSTQIIDITIDEYIKYEDIVQPFPTIFRLLDTTNNHEYTYGDKLKVGSKVKFASFSNLLPELYQPNGTGQYNGVTCVSGTVITVEKQMVFSWSASFTYLKTNAPKCIFSPSKLRMPNESYRYLGYIPDISGNGNNGVFNNFAFSKMSGVNGYLEDFTTLRDYGIKGIVRTDSKIYLDESFDYDKGFWLGYTNVPSPAYKVKISGIPETGMLTYTGGVWLNLTNGINELPARTNTAENHGFVVQSPNLDWSNLVIEQIPEYEGSICFDGVDDYITIPTLSEGGKQVLMKVNWQKQDTMLYNQNPGQDNFAIFTNDYNNNNLVVAYASRNNGNTYIDGVVNNNILATQLKGITHNIVATNNNIDATITPIIGSNKNHDNFFAQMALYDFMLFDEISTDEEIKELNNIVGIEGDYVQKPSYYWDAYGKTNTDADRDEIVNLASDEVSIQYPTDFTDTSVWEDMGAVTSSTILTLTTWAMGGDTGIGNTIKAKVATPAMKVKFITDGNGYLDYMYSGYNTLELPRDAGEYEVELPASTIVDGWGARFSGSGNGSFTIELLGNEVRLGTLKVINSAYDEDSGYGGAGLIVKFSKDYHDNGFWKFVENRSEFNVLNNGDSVNIINAKSVEALFYMAPTTKKAFYKVTGVSTGKGIKFGTDNVSPWEGVIAEKDGIYEVDWSLNVHTGTGDLLAPCILSNGWLGDCNIVIEQVKQYPNGIALDGVDDSLVNTDIPTFTDFTVIAKRTWLEENTSDKPFIIKGDTLYPDGNQNAFLFEYGKLSTYSFGQNNKYDESVVPSLISWATPTSYNGTTSLVRGSAIDTIGIDIAHATKMVFYKLFLYPRTIDMLSINMVKNMMEEDGIIDLTSKLFTDKYTGDFYEMDFNNDFFIGD